MSRKKRMPMVSVVVVNAKGTRHLETCLESLRQTDYPDYEVIVVDCLTTGIAAWLKEYFPNVKLIHFDYDIGASASHNVEDQADPKSEYLVFLDNDTSVSRSWLRALVEAMICDKTVGMAQAKILSAKDQRLMDHTGAAIDALGTWHTLAGQRGEAFRDVSEIFAASAACCIVRRNVFKEAGGFDSDYFIYDDDTDFSFRVWLLGYRVILVPSATIVHHGGGAKALTSVKLYHSGKNRVYTMFKNYEIGNLWWRYLLYSTLAFFSAMGFSSMGKPEEAKQTFKAMVNPIRNIKPIWAKRTRIQAKRCVEDSELLRRGLLRNDIRPTLLDVKLKWTHIIK